MLGDNGESQIEPHFTTRPHVNMDILMASMREQLEVLCPRNGNGSHNQVDETNLLTDLVDPTHLLLLELL